MKDGRWVSIADSQLALEQRGLDTIKQLLPERCLVSGQGIVVFHGGFAIRNVWPSLRELPLPVVSAASAHPHG